jgi:hypothetical protein
MSGNIEQALDSIGPPLPAVGRGNSSAVQAACNLGWAGDTSLQDLVNDRPCRFYEETCRGPACLHHGSDGLLRIGRPQLDSLGFENLQSVFGPSRNPLSFLLGQAGEEVLNEVGERPSVGKVTEDHLNTTVTEREEEACVACDPIQLRADQLGTGLPTEFDGLQQLLTVGLFAGFHLTEVSEKLATGPLDVVTDRVLLMFEGEAGLTLLIRTDPAVADVLKRFRFHSGRTGTGVPGAINSNLDKS